MHFIITRACCGGKRPVDQSKAAPLVGLPKCLARPHFNLRKPHTTPLPARHPSVSLTCRTMARRGRIESVRVWRICWGGHWSASEKGVTPPSRGVRGQGSSSWPYPPPTPQNPVLTLALRHAVHVFLETRLGAMPVVAVKGGENVGGGAV